MDFEKAKELMQRAKASSNNSINDTKDIDSIDGLSISDDSKENIDSTNNNCNEIKSLNDDLSIKNDSNKLTIKDDSKDDKFLNDSLSIKKDSQKLENSSSIPNEKQEQDTKVVRRRQQGGVMFMIKRERPLSSFY